jgi:two-component system nitrate/nitrite response regulator NarL
VVRLLVIDDIPDARALLRIALGRFGRYEVVDEADNAETGIELAYRLQPDGIILDVLLPGMSRIDALPPLLEAAPNAKVVLWSSTANATGDRAVELGAVGYVDKLEGVDPLVRLLDEVFPE